MMNYKQHIKEQKDFPIKGVSFKDISPILSDKTKFKQMIKDMGNLVDNKHIDFWVGIESRGFLFASALALQFGGGVVMCRKKGKLPPPIISYTYQLEYGKDTLEIQPGKGKVVIVDDVYATGGTMSVTEKLCKSAGYTIIDKLCFIDLKYLHNDTKCKSVVQYE